MLSHFQSGLMMTQIFIKMGYLLIFVSVVNFLHEIYSLVKDEMKFQIKIFKIYAEFAYFDFKLNICFLFY